VVKDEVEGVVPIIGGTAVSAARMDAGRVHLTLTHESGPQTTLTVDHVVCATGFKIEVDRTKFLAPELARQISHLDGAPKLSSHFESSVPGLYFIGPVAANAFGPMLRFACGAGFAARRVSDRLAATAQRVPHAVAAEAYHRSCPVDA
jgi:pyruvate/2-oxoglutarate dehydrogenase complex dihydrolipoamide dehydrogenase (E3) component